MNTYISTIHACCKYLSSTDHVVGTTLRAGATLGSENNVLAVVLLGWRVWARLMILLNFPAEFNKLNHSEKIISTWLLEHLVSLLLPYCSFFIFADILLFTPKILDVIESPRSQLKSRTSSVAFLTRSKMSSKL